VFVFPLSANKKRYDSDTIDNGVEFDLRLVCLWSFSATE
jgi:hypothetical protein